jgi:hypothetical protein
MAKFIENGFLWDNDAAEKPFIPTARDLYFASGPVDARRQEDLEREFFSSIKLKNGVYKYTYSNRLDDLNAVVEPLLPPARPLQLMDVAISSGISTLEWMESLERAGIEHHMTAGDLTLNNYLVSVGRHLHVLVDKTGYPLQFDVWGRAIPNPPGKRRLAIYFLPLMLLKIALRRWSTAMRPNSLISHRHVALVSPRLRRPKNLRLIEDDILNNAGLSRCYHVIRAANILHREYFDDPTIEKIIANLRSRLADGGLLIICKTEDPPLGNMASVYRLTRERRFEIVARIGGGSELDDLMLKMPAEIDRP